MNTTLRSYISKIRGFTLVELMVVIAIIALLTGIVVTNLSTSRAKARDAKRISDMGQIQLALELFFDRCGRYPAAGPNDIIDENDSCESRSGDTITIRNFISKIPDQPAQSSQSTYIYVTSGDNYLLRTTLEGYNEALKDGLDSNDSQDQDVMLDVTCDPINTYDYCIGPK